MTLPKAFQVDYIIDVIEKTINVLYIRLENQQELLAIANTPTYWTVLGIKIEKGDSILAGFAEEKAVILTKARIEAYEEQIKALRAFKNTELVGLSVKEVNRLINTPVA